MTAMLFFATVILVAAAAALVVGTGIDPQGRNFGELAWASLMRTLDPGTMGDDQGTLPFLLSMLAVTVGGLFVVGTLIGIITTGIENRLESMRKGRSFVAERDHTVILGWSSQVFTVVSELAESCSGRRKSCVAVLADRDKVLMEDELRARMPRGGSTRIVCRTGCPMDPADLGIINHRDARAVIILPPDGDSPDSRVIKTLLALVNNPSRKDGPYHIVSILRSRENLRVAGMVGRAEAQLVLAGEIIARITAQTCRQPGLSSVYSELLAFRGNEIYFGAGAMLSREPYRRAVHAFEDSCVIGIRRQTGEILLNPPGDTVIGPEDGILAIARDGDSLKASPSAGAVVHRELIAAGEAPTRVPETILILGWNPRVPLVIRELEAYAAPGSVITVAGLEDPGTLGPFRNIGLAFRPGDTSDRSFLETLQPGSCDHVIVQSDSRAASSEEADAVSLVTLLHLRDIRKSGKHGFTIVAEMLDERNRRLAEVSDFDDFIVSDKLVSQLLTQMAGNPDLITVFNELFDPEGSEIYLKPASMYVQCGKAVNFHTVTASACRRGETALGFASGGSVVLNPSKSRPLTLAPEDRVIVLAGD
jgi:voltage-gated potassium channel Kch